MIARFWNHLSRLCLPHNTFAQLAERCVSRVAVATPRAVLPPAGPRVGLVVTPWQQTAVPFYLVEWGSRLRRDGLRVEFIWDVWPNSPNEFTSEERTISTLLKTVSVQCDIPVVSPNASRGAKKCAAKRLEHLAFEAVTRRLKREPDWDDPAVIAEEERLRLHAGRVEAFLADRGYVWILIPGGVWAASGVYWAAAEAQGVGITTFDSGVGLLCFQHGGPAAHFPDLAESMRTLTDRCMVSPTVRRRVECWVNNRLEVRRRGKDEFQLQPTSLPSPTADTTTDADVVVLLNYRLDTAAMCRQRLFRSVNEWLRALVAWAAFRPDIAIAFRQHPCERIPAYRSAEDYSWIASSGANVRFISAEDPVNTYDLLRSCRVVLPYSSRVGIEAAVLGKPVVLAASTYYETMPFASVPESPAAYFSKIEDLLVRPPDVSERERCSAYAAYFVAENYGLHRTHFTPQPVDFEVWSQLSSEDLWSLDRNNVFARAIIERRAAADLLLEEQMAAWEKDDVCLTEDLV